ncbi:MAG: ISNCY family transposase [Methylococcales bacterium]|nr:ISNCY family transposase [Methylococcales bacterium]
MRKKQRVQTSIFDHYVKHEIGDELKNISMILDEHMEILDWVEKDIQTINLKDESGRKGMSVESVLRCAILKQHRQLSYEELSFTLLDSLSCQTFARLTDGFVPKKSALQGAISQIQDPTWERINLALLNNAKGSGIEKGNMLRIDSTVTETHIHEPTDSSLLWDSVRVMTRLLKQANEMGVDFEYHDHHRVAKKRARSIIYTRGKDKKKALYSDLVCYTEKTLQYINNAKVAGHVNPSPDWMVWCTEVDRYLPMINQVIDQTTRRVFNDEKVPASEKVFSLFETHTDIIVKGSRDIQYGHKLNFSTGRSGMVLDVVIESGNPADSDQFIPMVDRHIEHYGKAPRQAAADGGYASKENLEAAKQRNIKDVAFHKKRGLAILDMAKSPWVYRKLRNFRAGIEAGISYLKRCFGLSRCNWKGLEHFKTYVWSSVVTHNLVMMARLQIP